MDHFGIAASADMISNLRFAGIIPLLATIAAAFILRSKQGLVMMIGFAIYLIYEAAVFLFVYPAA
ncbi:hypothetical protein M2322_001900 [Rhodoblastus acidophilus]|uniref:hypothetical protein n=1 Tax=Rhodoblastus acidophilus TaxID=1074 RepID=UPI0022250034|nr:hypothetical protein [Rhodoblastus acidophilus]MCW2316352.1 hypothetical protein [Rhodoblastus acidophilus]